MPPAQGSDQPSFAALAHFQSDQPTLCSSAALKLDQSIFANDTCCSQRTTRQRTEQNILDLTKCHSTATYNGSPTFWLSAFDAEAHGACADSTMYVNTFSAGLLAYADTHHVVAWFVGYVYDLYCSHSVFWSLGKSGIVRKPCHSSSRLLRHIMISTAKGSTLTTTLQASDPPLLHRSIWLVLHYIELLFTMGSVLLPHCLHLRSGDVWYCCLQGIPRPFKSWQQSTGRLFRSRI